MTRKKVIAIALKNFWILIGVNQDKDIWPKKTLTGPFRAYEFITKKNPTKKMEVSAKPD